MRNQPVAVLVLGMLGLSGLLVVRNTSQPNRATTAPKEEKAKASAAAGTCDDPDRCEPVWEPLRLFFGVETDAEAIVKFQEHRSRVLIATVPDPLDSEVGLGFDQRLETLRMAAASVRYQPDRFYFPWRRDEKAPTSFRR